MSQRSTTCPIDLDGALEYFGDLTRKVKMHNLYETVPTLDKVSLSELMGKRIIPIIADKTAGGITFDGSFEISLPSEDAQGGPTFALFAHNVAENVLWAYQGDAVGGKKVNQAPDYAIINVMGQDSHQSNATVSQHYFSAVLGALEEGRMKQADLQEISQFVREKAFESKKNPFKVLQEMPDIGSPEFTGWLQNNLNDFESTKRLMSILARPAVTEKGVLPNIDAILENTRDVHLDGLDWGSATLLVKFDKEGSLHPDGRAKTLKELGVPEHKSYQYGLKGQVIGKFGRPIHWTSLWEDFNEAFLYGGNPEYTAMGKPRIGVRNEKQPVFQRNEKGKLIRDEKGGKIPTGDYEPKGTGKSDEELIGSTARRAMEITFPSLVAGQKHLDWMSSSPFKAIKSQTQVRDVVNAGVGNFVNNKTKALDGGISPAIVMHNIQKNNARGNHVIDENIVLEKSKKKDGTSNNKLAKNIGVHGLPMQKGSYKSAIFSLVDTDTDTIIGVVNNKRNLEYLTPVAILNAVDNGAKHFEAPEFSVTTDTLLTRLGFRRVDNGEGKVRYSVADNGESDGNRVQQYFDQGLRGLSLEDAQRYVSDRDRGTGQESQLLDQIFGQGTSYLGNKGNEASSGDVLRQQSLASTLLETSMMNPADARSININPALVQQAQQRTGILNE